MKEVERKYILKDTPVFTVPGQKIDQGYLTISDELEIRVRNKGDKYFITKKVGTGLVREETEIEISKDVFEILWESTNGRRVSKIRYKIDRWEVDVFTSQAIGLVIAEIELENENEVVPFPECFKRIWKWDVTENNFFKNQSISLRSAKTWPVPFSDKEMFWEQKKNDGKVILDIVDGNHIMITEDVEGDFPSKTIGWCIYMVHHDTGADSAMNDSKYSLFLLMSDGNVKQIHSVGLYGGVFRDKMKVPKIETTIRERFPEIEEKDLSQKHIENLKKFEYK